MFGHLFFTVVLVVLFCCADGFPQSSAISYQGQLTHSSMPPTGQYDFVFAIYQTIDASNPLATVSIEDVPVANGIFSVNLDFGSIIFRDNPVAVLEIRVRPGASTDAYTTLSPRTRITNAPRALTSVHAENAANAALATNAVTANFATNAGNASFATNAANANSATNAANANFAANAANADAIDGQDSTSFFSLGENEIVTGRPSLNGGTSGSTPPFTVDSNTLVTNLNADLLNGLSSSSFIQTTGGTMNGGLTASDVFSGTGNGTGVRGIGGSIGVSGFANGFSYTGNSFGVHAMVQGSAGTRYGLYAEANVFSGTQTAYGVYGGAFGAATNYAGYFQGNTHVSGTLTKGSGAFKIDHPLDPANKYLQHSFVESPDMMNIYNGNVTTDANGEVEVKLPDWFEALNRDFRYQLTAIGQFAQAIISEKVNGNRFKIMTDKPNVEVSWQVTGIRKDRFAEDNRIKVEETKLPTDKGKCLYAPLCDGKKLDPGEEARRERKESKPNP